MAQTMYAYVNKLIKKKKETSFQFVNQPWLLENHTEKVACHLCSGLDSSHLPAYQEGILLQAEDIGGLIPVPGRDDHRWLLPGKLQLHHVTTQACYAQASTD
jgi:hypothetical protein